MSSQPAFGQPLQVGRSRAFSFHVCGGIAGIGAYDEALCPQIMSQIMDRRQLTAAIIAGPDWPLINVTRALACPRTRAYAAS